MPETARFCSWCGAPRKLDAHLAERLGERKQATVLFADIVGSTARIVALDAEGALNFLQPIVAAMTGAVERFGGTVLRTMGDGLLAAFGVPQAREGHAVLACQAALAMRNAVAALPDAPMIRIGLHSGEVISRPQRTGRAVELDATGVTLSLGSRLEQAAEPGEIYLSNACRKLLGAYCDTEPLGARALKGIPDPVEVYRLIGMKPAVNSELFRGAALAPLRGRTDELELLQAALQDTAADAPRVIGLSGPPGIGKSRICFEFGEWCRNRQIKVLEARAHVFGRATPLLPVLEALRTFFRIEPAMAPDDARARIEQTLTGLALDASDDLPILADFLGCAPPGPPVGPSDPGTRREMLRRAFGRIMKAAGRETSVIIVEDLHWLDDASLEFLDTWIEAAEGTRILMVLTFRSGWSLRSPPAWYRQIVVADLGQKDISQLVGDLIGGSPALNRVVAHVAEQSRGNPFFAEELILSLAQSGVLLGERGRYRLAPSGWQDPALPMTVEAVIGARIDLLSDPEKALLQTAAIVGKEFPFEVVRTVSGLSGTVTRDLLERLRSAELIQPLETAMGESFAFRHPLIQEVSYAMQLRATRTRLHASVAQAIQDQEWGSRTEFAGLLAYHYEAAGRPVDAAMNLQRAARWIGRTNSGRALADWKKIRAMMRGQPHSKENDELRALACGQLLTFGWREGMPVEEARTYVDEALGYARAAGNRKHEVLLIAGYGRIVAANGSADEYVALVREALAMADAQSNPEGALLLTALLGQGYGMAGLLRESTQAFDAAMAMIGGESTAGAGVVLGLSVGQMVGFDIPYWIRGQQCIRAVMLGQFDEADTVLGRMFSMDAEAIDPLHESVPHIAAVQLAWFRGDAVSAAAHAAEVTAHAQRAANPYWSVLAHYCQGQAATVEGDYAAADRCFADALVLSRGSRAALDYEARILAHQADALLRASDLPRAASVTAEALAVARRRKDRLAECHASLVTARTRRAQREPGRAADVTALLERARALIEETGAKAYEPMLTLAGLE